MLPERLLSWDTDDIFQQCENSQTLAASSQSPSPETSDVEASVCKDFGHDAEAVCNSEEQQGALGPTWVNIWPQHIIEYPHKVQRQVSFTRSFFLCLAYRFGYLVRCLEEETVACLHDELRSINPGADTADQSKTIDHWSQFQRLTRRVLDRRQKVLGSETFTGPGQDVDFGALCLLEDRWPQDVCAIWPPDIRESWKAGDANSASRELEEIELACLTYLPIHSDPLRNQDILGALATLTEAASFGCTATN